MTWQRKWVYHLKRLLWNLSMDTRKILQMLFRTYLMERFSISRKVQNFVAFDKGKDEPERFIKFALTEMLLLLETTKDLWLGDGTFKRYPDMFYQLYTIHVTIGGYNPPCIYALLPNKTEKTYHDFTQALLQLIPNTNPERIKMDIEKAAVNAFSTTFPAAQITGSYYHLCQSVLRKINEVGLKKAYTTTPELALALKMIPATAFLPVEQVEDGFNIVMKEVGDILLRLKSDDEVSEKVEQFACYFRKTYMRGTNRAPLFEPLIWNQNSAASEGLARTNNAVEGWQYGIQSLFSGSHPDVWTSSRSSAKMLYSMNSMPNRLWLVTKKNLAENINNWMAEFKLSIIPLMKTKKISFLS